MEESVAVATLKPRTQMCKRARGQYRNIINDMQVSATYLH